MKKGDISIWKGKKGRYSLKTLKKMSESAKKSGVGKWMLGKKHKPETLLKMSKSKMGQKSPTWKGGITPVYMNIRNLKKYKVWRSYIFKRDNYTCQWCGQYGGKLNVDHIIPFSSIMKKLIFEQGNTNLIKKSVNYKLLWDTNNGRVLCLGCHKRTDTYKNKQKQSLIK